MCVYLNRLCIAGVSVLCCSRFENSKLRLSFNNLFDQHSIVAVTPASTYSNAPAPADPISKLCWPQRDGIDHVRTLAEKVKEKSAARGI